MKSSQPYQPLLLRILHGLTGLFLIAAVLTAFWTYNTYDGRWGKIPLPSYPEIEGVHGTFGLFTLLIFPVFVVYAFQRGQKRLIQPDSLAKLTQFGKPIWWYTLNRITNTVVIVALTFALFSGKMMDEKWLPNGELNHFWYYAHLIAWLIMVVCVALHLLMNAKVGGMPLLLSMLSWRFRAKDSPALWANNIMMWWCLPLTAKFNWLQSASRLEVVVLVSIVVAWVVSVLK
ncbi:cytochrome b/b6 domain-containing protein [Aliterella atlantica]|uniref:Cytochrome b(N-terminal)/b6/petB n=1 Tax=Aliterella atlantica CENA595 TaxID=1618023 RepID=A0A0D8ZT81_9CYAN|nr:cytochrome b/b6 domain-containing protein [Aliterella atlantica]KJH71669.1 cytochrome b(N-terminal)/b6/petB [Aliterella atlantica CENA595]